jgi:CHAD domain
MVQSRPLDRAQVPLRPATTMECASALAALLLALWDCDNSTPSTRGQTLRCCPLNLILAGALTSRRDAAFGKASAAVESRRYRSLLLDTLQWLETGDWAKHARYYKQRPIERFAADIFARRTKTITKKAKRIRELDSQQRHKLRIAHFQKYSSKFQRLNELL